MNEHHRYEDEITKSDMPKQLRWVMIFVDRVGFPVVAFILMCYICFVTLGKNTDVLTQNTQVLVALSSKIDRMDVR